MSNQSFFAVFLALALGAATGLASGLGLGGRPLPGTLRMASKSSLVYMASKEKGLHPALMSLLLTVFFGIRNISAISEIVIPVMPIIIGIFTYFLNIVIVRVHLLFICIVFLEKITKNMPQKVLFILHYCAIWGTFNNRGYQKALLAGCA